MKKIFALLLVLFVLVPCIVACSCDSTTDSSVPSTDSSAPSTDSSAPSTDSSAPSTDSSAPSTDSSAPSTDSSAPSTDSSVPSTDSSVPSTGTQSSTASSTVPSKPDDVVDDVVPDATKKWSGETLDVLATVWIVGQDPGAPWSQVELTVGENDWTSDAGFGNEINVAVLTRAKYIKDTYGVTINWINSRSNQISTLISASLTTGAGGQKYHIAMPRMMEAQTIVKNNSIYDMANGGEYGYINLDNSYYNQIARESYTVHGHTLFVAGDFSFLDEQTSYMIYYNMAMSESINNFPDLYQKVRDGKWTIDEMTNVAKLVSKQVGSSEWTDEDTYGFGTTSLSHFFSYSGIQEVSVNQKTGKYEITLNDSRVDALITKILDIQSATWARTSWTGGFGAMQDAFVQGRLLFYDEVIQKTDYFNNQTEEFRVGVLPAPKLSESQDNYYTPCSYQSVFMCIPKSTEDREMSEYFVEVLSYTGQKYVMAAYKETLETKMDIKTAKDSMDMIENYIFANLVYDAGRVDGWNGLLSSVISESFSAGKNNFTAVYQAAQETANTTVADWNLNWEDYYED